MNNCEDVYFAMSFQSAPCVCRWSCVRELCFVRFKGAKLECQFMQMTSDALPEFGRISQKEYDRF